MSLSFRSVKTYYDKIGRKLNQYNKENLSKNLTRYYDGGSPTALWAVRSAGIDPATGKEIFLTKDGKPTFQHSYDNEVVVGNTNPDVEGVWSNSLYWKGFSLNLHIRYSLGGQRFNSTLYEKVENIVKGSALQTGCTSSMKLYQNLVENMVLTPALDAIYEKYITEHFNGPVFITDWPKDIKAFYMKLNDDNKTVAAVDLEVPGAGELMGGSQREEDYDKLLNRMNELGMEEESMQWYLNLRRFGGCTHAGFGMGFERLLIYLTGVDNIRDVIPYPRTPGNCDY
jgi:hypothetical protein